MFARLVVSSCLFALAASASGLVVYRADKGLAFAEAQSVVINGKDKALVLGAQPKIAGPIGKLPSEKIDGSLIRDSASGVIAVYSAGEPLQYLLPQGTPKNATGDAAAIWNEAQIAYKKAQKDKEPTEVAPAQFVAYLSGGTEELADLCMDMTAIGLIGGKAQAAETQALLLSAAVKQFAGSADMARVERYVLDAMRSSIADFDNGNGSALALDRGLRFARLSKEAYAASADHERMRTALARDKDWLNRRVAVLKALYAAEQWDDFLAAYRDFEKHQQSFPEIMQKRTAALAGSLKEHWDTGKGRLGESEYKSAYRELRLATFRQPSNQPLQKDLGIAWTEYSRQIAVARRNSRKQLSAGERGAINDALHFAARYKGEGKLDEALKSVQDAENTDPESLPMLLVKAEVLGARGELRAALNALDRYDELAIDEEREAGDKLRRELKFQLAQVSRDLKAKLEAAWARKAIYQTQAIAKQGLLANAEDPDVLFYAGISALATRKQDQGKTFLTRYMAASNIVDADTNRRAAVLRMLAVPQVAAVNEAGDVNWLSGRKLEAGVLYCPLSLAFQEHVDHVEASNHMSTRFTWEGERLRLIMPTFEKAAQATGEKAVQFTYFARTPQVISVRYEDAPAITPSQDPDEVLRQSTVVLPNNPLIDPLLFERLTGEKATIGVAGNRFFHPFVWQKLVYFRLTYDNAGRVKQAHEIPDAESRGSEVLLEFDWDGNKLAAIHGYQLSGGDETKKTPIYERRQKYLEGRLIGEDIRAGGKASHIKYVYSGSQLVSAECDKDEMLDGRSRKVIFLASAKASGRSK